jgi:uncharacterized protein
MAEIGRLNNLEVVKFHDAGAYLDGGPYGEILLPNRYVTHLTRIGEFVDVFIYFDSEDRIVASTDLPYAMAGEFAYLQVISTTNFGAFLDWGLPKDLLLPFREQKAPVVANRFYVVYVYVDSRSNRIVATTKVERYLNLEEPMFQSGDEVSLLIFEKTDLGFKAIVNNTHTGVLYFNEVFKPLEIGQKIQGFIKKIRPDGKIDLAIEQLGYQKVDPIAEDLLQRLKDSGGFLPLNDNSDPELIKNRLQMSKKTFKKAVGALYKQKLIVIEDEGIRIV